MTPAGTTPREITRLLRPALLAAGAGTVLMLVGLIFSREQFFRGYMVAWLFVLGISLGSLGMVMLGHLVDGEWAWLIRRIGEAAALNLVVVAALFIPMLFGLQQLFPWAQKLRVAADPILHHKSGYLNVPWFIIRAAIYFIIWIALAGWVRRQSIENDRTGDPSALAKARRASAGGVLIYVITMTLASVDWILSRDPHWYSTIIGFATVVGQGLAGMAFMVWMLMRIAERDPISTVIERRHMNDLGNLLLTLVILWAYMTFSQFLVIWMGNSQEDNSWYAERGMGLFINGWRWVGLFLIVFHFFVPFFILLSRHNKRRIHFLRVLAIWLLFMRFVDIVWMIVPTEGRPFTFMVIPAILAIGGIWMAAFVRIVSRQPLLPTRSPLGAAGNGHGHESRGMPGDTRGESPDATDIGPNAGQVA